MDPLDLSSGLPWGGDWAVARLIGTAVALLAFVLVAGVLSCVAGLLVQEWSRGGGRD